MAELEEQRHNDAFDRYHDTYPESLQQKKTLKRNWSGVNDVRPAFYWSHACFAFCVVCVAWWLRLPKRRYNARGKQEA